MKIGIITIHKSEVNYGACLQCFALWKYVTVKGHECEIIDLLRPGQKGYIYKTTLSDIRNSIIFRLKCYIYSNIHKFAERKFKNRKRLFEKFNSQLSYSSITYRNSSELQNNPPIYDAYISGSDQIWNPLMPFDNAPYLLSFVQKGKRIAYASSFAVKELPEIDKSKYANLLSKYDALSTREHSGNLIVNRLLGKNIPIVLDPIFLLSPEEWLSLTDKNCLIREKYTLVYSLQINTLLLSYAVRIAKQTNSKVILVNAQNQICKMPNVLQLFDIGPLEWLNLISNAHILLTDSFHGTSFALHLKTPFITYINNEGKTTDRIYTLLSKVNLTSHTIDKYSVLSDAQIIKKTMFDDDSSSSLLTSEINDAKDYLNKALQL